MANIVPFGTSKVPAHLANRQASNDIFLAALPTGASYPLLGCKGTRFRLKSDGEEVVLKENELAIILLGAKTNLERNYYAERYDPNQVEDKAPDCFSRDGIHPDPSVSLKMHESCAGCPMNVFGTSTDAKGNPGKGKACRETKVIAVFAQGAIYGFKIPPTSLSAFKAYAAAATKHGVDLTTVVTVLGFDPNFDYPVFTFNMGGYLTEGQQIKCDEFKDSPEVHTIIDTFPVVNITTPTQIQAPVQKVAPPPPPADPFAKTGGVTEELPPPRKPRVTKPKASPVQAEAELMPPDEPVGASDDLATLANDLGLDL
jgi:hypothetical protein